MRSIVYVPLRWGVSARRQREDRNLPLAIKQHCAQLVKKFTDRAIMNEIRYIIERCRIAVDYG
jgi:hypothetical protein